MINISGMIRYIFLTLLENEKNPIQGFFSYAGPKGLEPSTSCVTGRRSNQAELRPQ